MSPQELHALAAEIAKPLPYSWSFYVIVVVLAFVSSALGAYVAAYMKKRGEQKAYASDFQDIKDQLRETTTLSETIRADVNRMSERSERLEWLKREKLERYVEIVVAMPDYMKSYSERVLFKDGEPGVYDPHPFATADMLCALYLPDLREEHVEFSNAVSALHKVIVDGLEQRTREAGAYMVTRQVLDAYGEGLDRLHDAVRAVGLRASEIAATMNDPES